MWREGMKYTIGSIECEKPVEFSIHVNDVLVNRSGRSLATQYLILCKVYIAFVVGELQSRRKLALRMWVLWLDKIWGVSWHLSARLSFINFSSASCFSNLKRIWPTLLASWNLKLLNWLKRIHLHKIKEIYLSRYYLLSHRNAWRNFSDENWTIFRTWGLVGYNIQVQASVYINYTLWKVVTVVIGLHKEHVFRKQLLSKHHKKAWTLCLQMGKQWLRCQDELSSWGQTQDFI